MSDILIQGGYVLGFDAGSTPMDPRVSFKPQDVLICGHKIVKIDTHIAPPAGATIIDATDHIVAPGFVDTHRHL